MRDSYRPAHRAKRSLPRLPRPRKPGKLLLTLAVAAVLLWSVSGPGRAFWNQMFLRSVFGGFDPDPAGLEIHVIDVGKADAILIRCQGHAGLIDTGAGGDGEDVADYLLRHGVKELEFVLLSHNDSDHIGGLPTVLGELVVDTLYQGELSVEEPSLEGAAMDRALSGWKGERRTLARGDSFSLGGASFSVLGPCRAYESSNDSSLVLRLEFGEASALFCGDIEATAELDLVKSGQELQADLLKVPHHGSATSCSQRFVKAVMPRLAAVSVGPDRNQLPRAEALEQLEAVGAQIYRTDTDGSIVFSSQGEDFAIETER